MEATTKPDSVLPEFDRAWNFSDIKGTQARFREIEAETRNSGNAAYRCELFTQIARTEGLQGNFEQALRTLEEAEELGCDSQRAKIRCLLERGRVFNSWGKVDLAQPLFLSAWEQANEASETNYAIDAAHMLGVCAAPETRLKWNETAISMAEQSTDPRAKKWLGALYNNVAWTYHDTGKYEDALELFRRALAWREEYGGERELQIAQWSVARALRSIGRVQEAIDMQNCLEKQLESKNQKDGYVYEELAELYLVLGEQERAMLYFGQAYAELSADEWFVQHEPARIKRLKVMMKLE